MECDSTITNIKLFVLFKHHEKFSSKKETILKRIDIMTEIVYCILVQKKSLYTMERLGDIIGSRYYLFD